VQETFAKVLRRGDSFREESSPLTWMYRISTNHCLNLLRNRRGRRNKLEQRHLELAPCPGLDLNDEAPDRALVRELLDQVDEETRLVVVHTWFDDCTRAEVAKLVGISVPTVRKRLTSFIDLARQHLSADLTAASESSILPFFLLLEAISTPWGPLWTL
jgi:RNA polymerase sigma-70 factor (ECF subfamily)